MKGGKCLGAGNLKVLGLSFLCFYPKQVPRKPSACWGVGVGGGRCGEGALNKLKGKTNPWGKVLQKLVTKGLKFLMYKKLSFTNQFRKTQGCQ